MLTVDQRIPLLLAVGTALAMLAVTGWQGYQFWQVETGPAPSAQGTETVPETPTTPAVPEVSLAELPLFGNAQTTQTQAAPDTENLPETDLRLVLRGALAASGEHPASALIEGPEGDTEVYLVGERLPGNARLRTVLPNRVILERGGKLENLYFPESDDSQGIHLTTESQTAPEASTEPDTRRVPARTTAPDEQNRQEETRRRLEDLRQRLQENN